MSHCAVMVVVHIVATVCICIIMSVCATTLVVTWGNSTLKGSYNYIVAAMYMYM